MAIPRIDRDRAQPNRELWALEGGGVAVALPEHGARSVLAQRGLQHGARDSA
ncbi:hypothetical protein [Amycolatopsis benzoatilytica]|uniref:hypothetical protein n=1 Tax=Amycolatopsis benzoatilytica TaxID=346045 RepID=UPI00036A27CD|nr:hypothetical protein [Amycolatopsis benzoatilytica]